MNGALFLTHLMIGIGYFLMGVGSLALVGAVVRGDMGRTFMSATAIYLAYLALQQNLDRLKDDRPPWRTRGGGPRGPRGQ